MHPRLQEHNPALTLRPPHTYFVSHTPLQNGTPATPSRTLPWLASSFRNSRITTPANIHLPVPRQHRLRPRHPHRRRWYHWLRSHWLHPLHRCRLHCRRPRTFPPPLPSYHSTTGSPHVVRTLTHILHSTASAASASATANPTASSSPSSPPSSSPAPAFPAPSRAKNPFPSG